MGGDGRQGIGSGCSEPNPRAAGPAAGVAELLTPGLGSSPAFWRGISLISICCTRSNPMGSPRTPASQGPVLPEVSLATTLRGAFPIQTLLSSSYCKDGLRGSLPSQSHFPTGGGRCLLPWAARRCRCTWFLFHKHGVISCALLPCHSQGKPLCVCASTSALVPACTQGPNLY